MAFAVRLVAHRMPAPRRCDERVWPQAGSAPSGEGKRTMSSPRATTERAAWSWPRPLVLALAAALATSGCLGGSSASAAAGNPTDVKIRLLTPLTGPTNAAGTEASHGAQLAAAALDGL